MPSKPTPLRWSPKWFRLSIFFIAGMLLLTTSRSQANDIVKTQSKPGSIVVPSVANVFVQTTGEQGALGIGDYYTNTAGDNTHHLVQFGIPCVPNAIFRVELFDPEIYDIAGETVNDETRNSTAVNPGDQTNFQARRPDGTAFGGLVTFGPYFQPPTAAPAEHNAWIAFQTITLPAAPVPGIDCGAYQIEVWTGNELGTATLNDDDNAWMYRLMGGAGALGTETFDAANGPDGLPGTGDEGWLGIQRLSYQHLGQATVNFYWFVDDDGTPDWAGRNFDADVPGICALGICFVNYTSPSGTVYPGTVGNDLLWNPGQATRGTGDAHTTALANTEPGLWLGSIAVNAGNQYIFEVDNSGKPIFLAPPVVPDVVISKTDGVTIVSSPGTTTYTITIQNIGDGAALPITGPELVDTLPAGMTFVSCTVNAPLRGSCTPNGQDVEFELLNQDPAQLPGPTPFGTIQAYLPSASSGLINSGTITLTVNVAAGVPDGSNLTNTAIIDWGDIYGNNYPPRSADDTDTVVVSATNADLSIVKTDAQDPIIFGNDITYNLAVTNNGPDTATSAVVTDTLPAGVTFVSASPGCTEAGGIVTCALGDLVNGAVVNLTITVTPGSTGLFTNNSNVTSPTPDPDPGDNGDPEDTTVTPPGSVADLAILKTDTQDPVNLGDNVTYTLAITNNGPATALNVIVTDPLPAGVTFVSASAGCVEAAGVVTCSLGDMVNGQVLTVSVTVTPLAAGTITNTATVTSPTPDPNPGNNSDPEDTTIPAPGSPPGPVVLIFDPALSKVGILEDGGIGLTGEHITWVLTLINIGNGPGSNIEIVDNMPGELRVDSADTDRGTASVNGQTVTFQIPFLNPGESVQMRIHTTVLTSPLDGTIVNLASMTAFGPNGAVTTTIAEGVISTPTSLPNTGYAESQQASTRKAYPLVWFLGAGIGLLVVGAVVARRAYRKRHMFDDVIEW